MQITAHFTLEELTRTATGLPNVLPEALRPNLDLLCSAVLEPWRLRVGRIRMNSGYRCYEVNEAVKGSPSSAHMQALAGDCVPLDCALVQAFEQLLDLQLPLLDQAILYTMEGFIHVGARSVSPRHSALVCADVTRRSALIPWATWRSDHGSS